LIFPGRGASQEKKIFMCPKVRGRKISLAGFQKRRREIEGKEKTTPEKGGGESGSSEKKKKGKPPPQSWEEFSSENDLSGVRRRRGNQKKGECQPDESQRCSKPMLDGEGA